MQKRFCECGKMIRVRYVLETEDLLVIFESRAGKKEANIEVCPECGRSLSIDDLR